MSYAFSSAGTFLHLDAIRSAFSFAGIFNFSSAGTINFSSAETFLHLNAINYAFSSTTILVSLQF